MDKQKKLHTEQKELLEEYERIDFVDTERFPLLERHGAGSPGKDTVPTTLGLFVRALDNYTCEGVDGNQDISRMGNVNLVYSVFGWKSKEWISKASRMKALVRGDKDKEKLASFDADRVKEFVKQRRTNRDAKYQKRFTYFVNHAIYTAAQKTGKEQDIVIRKGAGLELNQGINVMDDVVVNEMYESMDTMLRVWSRETAPIIRRVLRPSLYARLESHPITGDDRFSKTMYYVYARAYPNTEKDPRGEGFDLRRLVASIQRTYAEDNQLTATIESLRAIVLGILFGPMGLMTYGRETNTYYIESVFTREWRSFNLTQLRSYRDIISDSEPKVFDVGQELVTIGPKADFTPIMTSITGSRAIAESGLVIRRVAGEDGAVSWVLEASNPDACQISVWRAVDDLVVMLEDGSRPVTLHEGDEIWLGTDQDNEARDYETGAVLLFHESWDYVYRDEPQHWANDDAPAEADDEASEAESAVETDSDSQKGERIGFCLSVKNEDAPSQNTKIVEYSEIADANGWFEFTIGRRRYSVDYVCNVVGGSAISRLHATLLPDGNGGVVLHDGRLGKASDISTNGSDVVRRDRTVVHVGKGNNAYVGNEEKAVEECDLRDGDELWLPSKDRPETVLQFSYRYSDVSHDA